MGWPGFWAKKINKKDRVRELQAVPNSKEKRTCISDLLK